MKRKRLNCFLKIVLKFMVIVSQQMLEFFVFLSRILAKDSVCASIFAQRAHALPYRSDTWLLVGSENILEFLCHWSFSMLGIRGQKACIAGNRPVHWNCLSASTVCHRWCHCHIWSLTLKGKPWYNIGWKIGVSSGKTSSKDSWDHISICVVTYLFEVCEWTAIEW